MRITREPRKKMAFWYYALDNLENCEGKKNRKRKEQLVRNWAICKALQNKCIKYIKNHTICSCIIFEQWLACLIGIGEG